MSLSEPCLLRHNNDVAVTSLGHNCPQLTEDDSNADSDAMDRS